MHLIYSLSVPSFFYPVVGIFMRLYGGGVIKLSTSLPVLSSRAVFHRALENTSPFLAVARNQPYARAKVSKKMCPPARLWEEITKKGEKSDKSQ